MLNFIKKLIIFFIPYGIVNIYNKGYIGIFFQGIYLKIKYRNFKPKYYLSVVAVIKNEGQYLVEWLEFHKLVGVEKFYLYDNESEDNTKDVLQPYIQCGMVEYYFCPGKAKQEWAYNDILKKTGNETFWLALIDIDEFILPIEKETIPMILKEFEGYGGLGVHWLIYGSGWKDKKDDGFVIERFKDHSETDFFQNKTFKMIINPRWVSKIGIYYSVYDNFFNVFYSIFKKGFCVNENHEKLGSGPFNATITIKKIRINYYFSKSKEEYLKKRESGRSTMLDVKKIFENFEKFNKNDIKNDTIMDIYAQKLKKELNC